MMPPRCDRRLRATLVALSLLATLGLSACSVHQVKQDPAPSLKLPERFSATGGQAQAQVRWWKAFGDEGLDKAVAAALAGNLDLTRAGARLGMAAAMAAQSGAAVWPQVTLEASVNSSRNSMFIMGQQLISESTTIPLTLGASYEVDLWGRVASMRKAAALDVKASAEDRDALAMSLSAQVAEVWYSLVEQGAQRALLDAQIALAAQLQELVELRFGQGQSNSVAVLQQRQQVSNLKSQLPLFDARIAVLRHQLSALLGRSPAEPTSLPSANALPKLPALPAAGVPAALLARRPDVRAARLRVQAADHRVGMAIADRFPALRLSGRTGFQGRDGVADLFDNWIWSLIGGLTAPLIDGGRRAAEVERSKLAMQEAVAGYSQAVLKALFEVEDALVRERQQIAYLTAVEQRVELARATLAEARSRFAAGLGDYLPVLTALQSQQQAERDHLTASRQLLTYRIALYRALAGAVPGAGQAAPASKPAASASKPAASASKPAASASKPAASASKPGAAGTASATSPHAPNRIARLVDGSIPKAPTPEKAAP